MDATLPTSGFGRPTTVALLMFPGFSMMALASTTEPLRAANLISGKDLYRWHIVTPGADDAVSSSGFRMASQYRELAAPASDLLLVIASLDFDSHLEPALLRKLVRIAGRSRAVGAVSNGSIVLARAGLLDGYECTVHWERLRELQTLYPEVRPTREVYCIDRDRWTCSGGTAAMDMMLALVRAQHGPTLAMNVANNFLHGRIRRPDETQPMEVRWRYGVQDRRLAKAIGFMEQSIENPLPLSQLADLVGLSPRQLQRLFASELTRTPERFYVELRLRVARDLLEHTDEAVGSIGLQCGFANASHFTRAFQGLFGIRPSALRSRSPSARLAQFGYPNKP